MYGVDLIRRVRLACHHEGLSRREAARRFGIDRKTVAKMLSYSVPPGYRRSGPPRRPKLDPYTGIIDRILNEDRDGHRKGDNAGHRHNEAADLDNADHKACIEQNRRRTPDEQGAILQHHGQANGNQNALFKVALPEAFEQAILVDRIQSGDSARTRRWGDTILV